ncbi:NitT/TauT family transport system permease protein [Aminobacter aminovorans]|uniref:Aliphatic sulfonates transport permease protein ssuC n=1 Tax=Aminobacter aminovorans TaxID=83263 RepID=A0A381ILX0_AMIAI|nr:ABC transporter permease [Aminobacter aminovorans]TCS25042.1 NitT/TauT family transport system permease protein [Aminobacter aminovorans]SUY28489.1 Putative aliphatic sulfonates transport permease protein ssuC [Aminobacter aminovorans]
MTTLAEKDSPALRPVEGVLEDPAIAARRRENRLVLMLQLALAVGILGLWEIGSGWWFSDFWVSSPSQIVQALWAMTIDGRMVAALGATVTVALSGFALGAAFGVALGILLGLNPVVARVLDPYLVGLYSLPRVALVPLFVLWLGIGFEMKVAFTALLVFFPIFMNTLSGVRSVDADLIDVIKVMGASRWNAVAKVFVPSALSWVFAGLRISAPFALIGAVVAEMFSSNRGLGYLISVSASQFDTAGLFAALVVTTLLGLLLDAVVVVIGRHLLRWQ